MVPSVVLEQIDGGNWREALDVYVTDEQLPFVGDHQPVALVILAKCYVRPGGGRWEPLLIRDRSGTAVGVLAIDHAEGEGDCEVHHFAIDASSQGRGLGTAAAIALVDRARGSESACEALTVGAHRDNTAAHRIYRVGGFVDTGERGNERTFRLDLS